MKRAQNWQKILDRFLGIPLLFGIALINRSLRYLQPRRKPEHPQSLAIFCVAALGDLLLLSAPLKAFHNQFPDCSITLYCGPDNKSLIPLLDPQGTLFCELQILNPRKTFSYFPTLRKRKYDLLIDSGQWSRWSALMALLTPAQWRIGFRTKGQARHFLFDQIIEHSNRSHEVENFQNLFSGFLCKPAGHPQVESPSQTPTKKTKPQVICHLFPSGSSPEQKEWPAQNWLELFAELNKRGYEVILTGAPADRERLNKFFTQQDLGGVVDLVGKTSLAETRDRLAQADLVISINTGIMHLAAAVDAPLIALHGPTDPKRWGPVSPKSIVVQSTLGCSPCLNLGFDYGCPRNDCMKNITVEQVLQAVEKKRMVPS